MYTDNLGYYLLKNFGYDELKTDLEDIDEKYVKFFSYSKYVALKNEPCGYIHIDFDVFLKRNCIDEFFDSDYDCAFQNLEYDTINNECYVNARKYFTKNPFYEFLWKHTFATNVGIIGFNNNEAKKEYLDTYKNCVDFYADKLHNVKFIPDLFFEQIWANFLCKKNNYKVFYVIPEMIRYGLKETDLIAERIGFQHILGGWKSKPEGKKYIHEFYTKCENMKLFD